MNVFRRQAYWPFHKADCKHNEFADVIEAQEPKFARFLRKHGKQAQLKDDEVDRIERASKAASGVSRTEVMESMYGRLDPKPKGGWVDHQSGFSVLKYWLCVSAHHEPVDFLRASPTLVFDPAVTLTSA